MPRDLFDDAAWAHYTARYDAEIRFVDAELGRLFTRLEELGIAEKAVVALTADHGEWLGEDQRWNHCQTVLEPEVHVPLLLRVGEGGLGRTARSANPASTLDLLPTLAALAGAELPAGDFDGADLRAAPADRVVATMWAGQVAVRDGSWKLILERGAPSRLYDVARDPEERWNRLQDRRETAERLAARAEPFVAMRRAIDAEKIERALKKIGYIR
jgi:choline-sulfatase